MSVPFSTKKSQVYELKVEVKGDDTTAYVDGKEMLAFSHKQLQQNEMLDKGAVGIRIFLLVSTPQAFGGGELPFRKL